jgi:hypothetical protein
MSRKHPGKQHHNQSHENQPSGIERGASHDAVAVNPDAPHSEARHEASPGNEEPAQMPKKPDLMTIFTGVLALFAVLSFVALWIQVRDARDEFTKIQRPWVGFSGEMSLDKFSFDGEMGKALVGYKFKNYGTAPALNTVVWLERPVGTRTDYELIRTKVEQSCRSGETIFNQTGDLLLPSAEKTDTWNFTDKQPWPDVFIIPGCIVYHDVAGRAHHTQLCYYIDLTTDPKPTSFRTCWFQHAD